MSPNPYPWAFELIGKPWVSGARGPEAFDCWGLVAWVYREVLGITLPEFPGFDPHNVGAVARAMEEGLQSADWEPVKAPESLCLVAMSQSRRIHHVGLWLAMDGGLTLHAMDGRSVVAQSLASLRGIGINRQLFYRYVSSNLHQQPV